MAGVEHRDLQGAAQDHCRKGWESGRRSAIAAVAVPDEVGNRRHRISGRLLREAAQIRCQQAMKAPRPWRQTGLGMRNPGEVAQQSRIARPARRRPWHLSAALDRHAPLCGGQFESFGCARDLRGERPRTALFVPLPIKNHTTLGDSGRSNGKRPLGVSEEAV